MYASPVNTIPSLFSKLFTVCLPEGWIETSVGVVVKNVLVRPPTLGQMSPYHRDEWNGPGGKWNQENGNRKLNCPDGPPVYKNLTTGEKTDTPPMQYFW